MKSFSIFSILLLLATVYYIVKLVWLWQGDKSIKIKFYITIYMSFLFAIAYYLTLQLDK